MKSRLSLEEYKAKHAQRFVKEIKMRYNLSEEQFATQPQWMMKVSEIAEREYKKEYGEWVTAQPDPNKPVVFDSVEHQKVDDSKVKEVKENPSWSVDVVDVFVYDGNIVSVSSWWPMMVYNIVEVGDEFRKQPRKFLFHSKRYTVGGKYDQLLLHSNLNNIDIEITKTKKGFVVSCGEVKVEVSANEVSDLFSEGQVI